MEDLEYALIFGKKSKYTGGTQTRYMTDGALNRLGTFLDVNGTLTHAKWRTFRQTVTQYGGTHKIFIGGPIYLHYISSLKYTKQEIQNNDPAVNIAVYRYVDDFGTMDIINGQHIFRDSDFQYFAVALDMDQISIKAFKDLQMFPDCVKDGSDQTVDKWEARVGLEMMNTNAHYGFYGATSYE